MNAKTLTTALLLAALGLATPAPAQWFNDPINGMVPVCDAPGHQRYPRVCNLAGNRTFVGWIDERTYPERLYYQVLDPYGNALLQDDGVPLVEGDWGTIWEGDADNDDAMIPDGSGGCIAVFMDGRDGSWDVYAQRIDSLGNSCWGANGIGLLIWPGSLNQMANCKSLCADTLGNFFASIVISGDDLSDIYIQKFRAEGMTLWGSLGAPVVLNQPGSQEFQSSVPDMNGGIFDIWKDARFSTFNPALYMQHLDSNGDPEFELNGIPVRDMAGQPVMGFLDHGVPDGQGGGIWARTTFSQENWFYLFRLNSQGQMLWEWTTGNMSMHGFGQQLLRHPADGTFWFYLYENVPGHHGVFLYRFDFLGTPLFGNRGLPFAAYPMIATSNGIIEGRTEWKEHGAIMRTKIWAQRIDSTGARLWNLDVALGHSAAGGNPSFGQPQASADGADGMIFVFEDNRYLNQTGVDITAQRVLWNGRLGAPAPPGPITAHHPADLSLSVSPGCLAYTLPVAGQVKIELFDVLGRPACVVLESYQDAGQNVIPFDDRGLASGIYLLRLTAPFGRQIAKVAVVR